MMEVTDPTYLWVGGALTPLFFLLALWARRRRLQEVAYLPLWEAAARRATRRIRLHAGASLLLAPLLPLLIGAGLAEVRYEAAGREVAVFLDDSRELAATGGGAEVLRAAQLYAREHREDRIGWYAATDGADLHSLEGYRGRIERGGSEWGDGDAVLRGILERGGRAVWLGAHEPGVLAAGLQIIRAGHAAGTVRLRDGWRAQGRLWGIVENETAEAAEYEIHDGRGAVCAQGVIAGNSCVTVALTPLAGATSEAAGFALRTFRLRLNGRDAPATELRVAGGLRCAMDGEGLPDVARFLRVWQAADLPAGRSEDVDAGADAGAPDVLFARRWPQRLPRRALVLIAPETDIPGLVRGGRLDATGAAAAYAMREDLPDAALQGLRSFAVTEWYPPAEARILAYAGSQTQRVPLLAQWRSGSPEPVQVYLLAALPQDYAHSAGCAVLLSWLMNRIQAQGEARTLRRAAEATVEKSRAAAGARATGPLFFWCLGCGCFLLLLGAEWRGLRGRGIGAPAS